jgi:hypothetical protein
MKQDLITEVHLGLWHLKLQMTHLHVEPCLIASEQMKLNHQVAEGLDTMVC